MAIGCVVGDLADICQNNATQQHAAEDEAQSRLAPEAGQQDRQHQGEKSKDAADIRDIGSNIGVLGVDKD